MLKIRVLNVSKKDLLKDLERAAEFDQSALFKKIYEEEYGTFGGAPFGALIGDYEFGNHPQDMSLLEKISNVAAAANAPFISAASPELFGWETFTELTEVRDLAKIFDRTEYAKWRSFRDSEDSRYVGLTLPHTLMRLPYGQDTVPVEAFNFEEDVDGKDHKKYLWGNAAYSFGTRLTEAFALYNWTRRDPRRGGGRARSGASRPHLPDRRRRRGAEVPDRDRDHRPPREGVLGPRLPPARPLQEHRLRGVLRRAVGAEGEEVRHRFRERERASLDAAPLHLRRVPFRPLPQGDHARQDRQLRLARGRASSSSTGGSRTTSRPTTRRRPPSRRSSRFARPASRSRKSRASPASTRRSPSSGRTSSSTSCRSPCGWWPSCRLRRGSKGRDGQRPARSSPASAPAPATRHAEDRRGDPDQPVGPRPARRLRAGGDDRSLPHRARRPFARSSRPSSGTSNGSSTRAACWRCPRSCRSSSTPCSPTAFRTSPT